MSLTPLKKELGEDLNEIKTLIDERLAVRQAKVESISATYKEIEVLDSEVRQLRDHASYQLGTKADRSEGKTPRGGEKPERPRGYEEITENTL